MGLNPDFLDVIAQTMAIARESGVFLLFTSNDLPDAGGYYQIADRANSAWSIVNEQWVFTDQPPMSLDAGIVTAADGNTFDLADAEHKRRLVTTGVLHYIETVAAVIRRHDPHGLVTGLVRRHRAAA